MTGPTVTIDSHVLDMLADEKIVNGVSEILECARAAQRLYAEPPSDFPRSSWGGSPQNDRTRHVRVQSHYWHNRRSDAGQMVAERLARLAEDIAREEYPS